MNIKRALFLLFFFSFVLMMNRYLNAYTDEIQVSSDEVWKAAEEVFKPIGIHKFNPKKRIIESDWIQDHVKRSSRLFPVGPQTTVKRTYDRRYRVHVQINEDSPLQAQVVVKGRFQLSSPEPYAMPRWHSVIKPTIEDYDIERDFFFKILRKIEDNRRAVPST